MRFSCSIEPGYDRNEDYPRDMVSYADDNFGMPGIDSTLTF
jgi:hypothetical protein